MYTVAQIAGAAEACVLVHDPDGRLGGVEALRPGDDGLIQVLNLGVVVAKAHGDNLSDLVG